jgi:hypothetical protein
MDCGVRIDEGVAAFNQIQGGSPTVREGVTTSTVKTDGSHTPFLTVGLPPQTEIRIPQF